MSAAQAAPVAASGGSVNLTNEREFLEDWLRTAAEPTGLECCGHGIRSECCGNPEAVYLSFDEFITAMNDRLKAITSLLAAHTPQSAAVPADQGNSGPRYIANPDEFQTKILHAMYRAAQRGDSVERMHFDVCEIISAQPPAGELPVLPDLFAEFCEREGYPSDGPFDAALRKAFDAGCQQGRAAAASAKVPK